MVNKENSIYELLRHKHNPYLKAGKNNNTQLRSQIILSIINTLHPISPCICSMCQYCVAKSQIILLKAAEGAD